MRVETQDPCEADRLELDCPECGAPTSAAAGVLRDGGAHGEVVLCSQACATAFTGEG